VGVVVFGFYGTQLDGGIGAGRWQRWRPTISLFQHDELAIDRLILLVPDADAAPREFINDVVRLSPETTVETKVLALRDAWDFEEVYAALHDAARSLSLADDDDLLVHITTGTHVAQICLFLLTEARFLPGRLLQSSPPAVRGDAPRYAIIDLDLGRYDAIARRFAETEREGTELLKQGIATKNAAFNQLMDELALVSVSSPAPILLTGPTGAGKSQLARRVYELKRARHQLRGPMVEVNCATLRGDHAMSALFGHRRGAFTGAIADRDGLLLAADHGLLFLDEIGELGLDEQAMLLRAVEERRFLPVGSEREVRSDFQLIAGTNRDLWEAVAQGRFREDLLARVDLWTFRLPGLAERREDIAPNLDHELERFARSSGRRVGFSREARARFLAFATAPDARWRGNFRDLSAAVTRMATLAPGGRVDVASVDREAGRLRASWAGASSTVDRVAAALGDGAEDLDRFDRVQLADVLEVCARSRTASEAGRELFAASRAKRSSVNDADRLRKYLARFGLSFDQVQERA
jgi:transcriptional regulatory protein RtcR